jgi:hypothetical protein
LILTRGEWPPLRDWLVEGLLLFMITGLLSAWRYEVLGGTLALVASFVFFVAMARRGGSFSLLLRCRLSRS